METIIIVFICLSCLKCFAQTADTSAIQQYCEMLCTQKLFSPKVNITMDFGDKINYWKDRRLKDSLGSVINFNSVIDAMNYLGKQGWKLQSSLLLGSSGSYVYHYIFEKDFRPSELQQ